MKVIAIAPEAGLTREDEAKLQALYSRSDASVAVHLDKVKATSSTDFMNKFYVGYGHNSIADCATDTLFIEGVTHLCAKAIQSHALYAGQECSTRYIEFGSRPVVAGPTEEAQGICRRWLQLYRTVYRAVSEDIALAAPPDGTGTTANAVHAAACDVARSMLPCGSTTQLSWATTLRQFKEHILSLGTHPLAEVRKVAAMAHSTLAARHPGTFSGHAEERPAAPAMHYLASAAWEEVERDGIRPRAGSPVKVIARVSRGLYAAMAGSFEPRGPREDYPKALDAVGGFTFGTRIDFGGFRDLQRHRRGSCPIPMLRGDVNIHPWYLGEMPEGIRAAVADDVGTLAAEIGRMAREGHDPYEMQYLYPLGHVVETRQDYPLSQAVYVAELRSGRHVHPTLREVATDMAAGIEGTLPGIALRVDRSAGGFDVARGRQTIVWA